MVHYTQEQQKIVKANIIRLLNLTTIQLQDINNNVIKTITKQNIDNFDNSHTNLHIIEKTGILHVFLCIGNFGSISIDASNRLNFLNTMLEHILNPKIIESQFYKLLQNYKP